MEDLVGDYLWDHQKEQVPVQEALTDKTMIGCYFSAHWSPPSRLFDQTLKEFYNHEINRFRKYSFQIVWFSEDRTQDSYERHLQRLETKWLHFKFDEDKESEFSKIRETVKRKLGASKVPQLVVLSYPDLMLLSIDAVNEILQHGAKAYKMWQGTYVDGYKARKY